MTPEELGLLLFGCIIGVVVMGIATILDREWEHRVYLKERKQTVS